MTREQDREANREAKRQELVRKLYEYQNRRDYGTYNFCIKVQKIDVPDSVRHRISEEELDERASWHAQCLLEGLIEELKEEFAWIETVFQDGRSGGWLAINEKDGLRYQLDTMNTLQDEDLRDMLKTARARIKDLAKIEKYVKETVRGWVKDQESEAWWFQEIPGEKKE